MLALIDSYLEIVYYVYHNMAKESGWKKKSKEEIKVIQRFSEEYKSFLNLCKTEREAVRFAEGYLGRHGFNTGTTDSKVIYTNRGKEVIAFIRGREPIDDGINIVAVHIDAPRLDLKPNPLYEDVDLALLRTHYYGGVKKYQWVTIPLSLHGVVVKTDGTSVEIVIGEKDEDPVFAIDDLLPHLSRKRQDEKTISQAIEAEKLTIIFGNIPLQGEPTEGIKKAVLKILDGRYGIREDDFTSAEIEAVPAFKARDVGIDRSMVGGYGQDDRICAYALLAAMGSISVPDHPCLAIFTDKEEIGSEGNTGIKSHFFRLTLDNILEGLGQKTDDAFIRKVLFRSRAISADVTAPVNPMYQDVHEKQNACLLGHGISISKYTGHMGKVGGSDANAEYLGAIRALFDRNNVLWQTGELGRVDEGGGGTVARFLAEYGMDIIDCGTPVLSMHSPFEISSKLDLFETFRALKVFLES